MRQLYNINNRFFLIFFGIVAFSCCCTYLTMDIFHFPFCLVEIFLPFFFLLFKDVRFKTSEVLFSLFFLAFFFLLGLMNPSFVVADLLPTVRSYFLIIMTFIFFKNNKENFSSYHLFYLSLGSVLGNLFYGIITYVRYIGEGSNKEYAVDMNVLAITLLVASAVLSQKSRVVFIIFVVCLVTSFFSVSRGIVLFFLAAFLISYLILLLSPSTSSKSIPILVGVLVIGVFAVTIYERLESLVEIQSSTIHHRLYTKIDQMGEVEGDNIRMMHVRYILNNIDDYLLPRGFVGRNVNYLTQTNRDIFMVRDSCLAEIFYMFGGLALILFFYHLKVIWRLKTQFKETGNTLYGILLACALMLILNINFGYGLLMHPFSVPFVGMYLGLVYKTQKRKNTHVLSKS